VAPALADAGVSVSLGVPLFGWGGAAARAARARLAAAEEEERAAVEAVAADVREALGRLRAAQRRRRVIERAVLPALERAARALREAEARGGAPLRRALEFTRRRLAARRAWIDARAAETLARLALARALGVTSPGLRASAAACGGGDVRAVSP